MKIEKLNDNQIRCTLTRADLADREIKLSELVCGTDKAKSLFHDMMQQAFSEFGFEAEDMPLMIEAVPTTSGSVVLIITRVDDPEELDSKFAKYSTPLEYENKKRKAIERLENADEILDLLNKVKNVITESTKKETGEFQDNKVPGVCLFSFSTLDCVIQASRLLKTIYTGANTLYKEQTNGLYVLVLTQSNHTAAEFHKVCTMLSEYGCQEKASSAFLAYLEEHCEVIVSTDAIQQLSNI